MAAEQAQTNDFPVEMEPLDILTFKLRKTQKLLLVFAAACSLSLILGTALLALVLLSGSRLAQAEYRLDELNTQLSEQLAANAARITATVESTTQLRAAFDQLDGRMAQLDINDPDNVLIKVQRILIRQERDYRDFLTDLERGMHDLQKMIPHSRGWWDSYSEQMQESLSLSQARENYLLTLREN